MNWCQVIKKQLEDYEQFYRGRNNDRLLLPDGLHFICEVITLMQKKTTAFLGGISEDMSEERMLKENGK